MLLAQLLGAHRLEEGRARALRLGGVAQERVLRAAHGRGVDARALVVGVAGGAGGRGRGACAAAA